MKNISANGHVFKKGASFTTALKMLARFVCKVSWNVLVSPLNVTEFDIGEPRKNITAETAQRKHAQH